VAGEANAYAMTATHIPATEEELDRWLVNAQTQAVKPGDVAHMVLCGSVERLVGEVVLGRSLHRLERDKLEDAKRAERANAVLLQRAEQRIAELQRELDEMTTNRNLLKEEERLRREADAYVELLRREAGLPPGREPSLLLWIREKKK
jgi:TolA-binding protein